MRVKNLLSLLNLEEMDIVKVYNENNNGCMLIEATVDIELIANGYRPAIEMTPRHLLIFKNRTFEPCEKRQFIKSYIFESGNLIIQAETNNYEIDESLDVEFIPNFTFHDGVQS